MRSPKLRLLAGLLALLAGSGAAGAPIAAPRPVDDIEIPLPERPPPREVPEPEPPAPIEDESEEEPFIPGRTSPPSGERAGAGEESAGDAGAPAKDAGPPADDASPRRDPDARPIALPPAGSPSELAAAFLAYQRAAEAPAPQAAQEVERRIEALRTELGYQNLFAFSLAASLQAERLLASNREEALRRALFSAGLSPDSPHALWTAARVSLSADPANPGCWGRLAARALAASWREPRWRMPGLAEAAGGLLLAVAAAAASALALFFVRHARYFLHDFRHLFPEGASAWQTTPLAVLVLALPLAVGHSPFAFFLVLALASWGYLERGERLAAAAALGVLGGLPLAAESVAERTAFAGTRAEVVWLVERGGLEGESVAALRALGEKEESFPVLFALGREARRRGALEATALLRRASALDPDSAEAALELGNALLLEGDIEAAREAYQRASSLSPERAEPFYNLSRLHGRKSQLAVPEEAGALLARAQEFAHRAIELDPALGQRLAESDPRANATLATMPLPLRPILDLAAEDAAGARVGEQVASRLFGPLPPALAPAVAGLSVLLLFAVGLLGGALRVSSVCSKCGRPVCGRCDAEVTGPGLCGQCLNVFARRGAVDAAARAAKEQGVRRYERRRGLALRLSSAVAGAAHILSGRTATGACMLLAAFGLTFAAVFSRGVVPAPAAGTPALLRAAPCALGVLGLVALSVRYARAPPRPVAGKASGAERERH
jgi:tetratricopeptide (TPR) repeat protein